MHFFFRKSRAVLILLLFYWLLFNWHLFRAHLRLRDELKFCNLWSMAQSILYWRLERKSDWNLEASCAGFQVCHWTLSILESAIREYHSCFSWNRTELLSKVSKHSAYARLSKSLASNPSCFDETQRFSWSFYLPFTCPRDHKEWHRSPGLLVQEKKNCLFPLSWWGSKPAAVRGDESWHSPVGSVSPDTVTDKLLNVVENEKWNDAKKRKSSPETPCSGPSRWHPHLDTKTELEVHAAYPGQPSGNQIHRQMSKCT